MYRIRSVNPVFMRLFRTKNLVLSGVPFLLDGEVFSFCPYILTGVTGLKPSFSVDFSVNEGYFVSNMVVVLVLLKMAVVKQTQIVKRLINTGKSKMQRSAQQR